MGYGFQIRFTDPAILESHGFGKVAGVPCIFDPTPRFHRLSSEFLIDRALGYWDPKFRGKEIVPNPPTGQSIKNYAEWLCNLLDWCEHSNVVLLSIRYSEDLIGRYQKDMLNGSWSRDGEPLAAATVNVRVDTAVDFSNWCFDKGYREEFHVPKVTRTVSGNALGDRKWRKDHRDGRRGKVRRKQKRLCFPAEDEVKQWRKEILARADRGGVEYLIVDLIMETAIRREEAACWRVDTIPINEADWSVVDHEVSDADKILLVEVKYGTKGKEYGRDHGDKIGPAGVIRVPYLLAKRIAVYRLGSRTKSLATKIKKGTTLKNQKRIMDDTVHLFLKPEDGERYTGTDIYEFWRRPKRPQGWSPHRARDYWSCSVLLKRMQQYNDLFNELKSVSYDKDFLSLFRANCESVIQLEIRPQLRHVTSETSMVYLQWLADKFGVNLNLHDLWMDSF